MSYTEEETFCIQFLESLVKNSEKLPELELVMSTLKDWGYSYNASLTAVHAVYMCGLSHQQKENR